MKIPDLTCRELVDFLDEYLDGLLPPARRDEFDAHLALCPACIEYLNTYREAVRLGRASLLGPEAAPAEIPEDLVLAILGARGR